MYDWVFSMSILDLVNLISSIASLILSIIAIWLSLYFYKESKNNEQNVNNALSEIKIHTATLEKLTGKWLDRLTRFVTSPQPMDAAAEKILETMGKLYQGNNQTGTVETPIEQPLMYKEEEIPKFAQVKNKKEVKKKGKTK